MTESNNNQIFDGNGNKILTREYQYTKSDGTKIIIQNHSGGHSYPGDIGDQVAYLNDRPSDNTRTGSVRGTYGHYNF